MLSFRPYLAGLFLLVSTFFYSTCAVKITVLNSCAFALNAAHTADPANAGYKEGCQLISSGSKATIIDSAKLRDRRWVGGRIWATRQTCDRNLAPDQRGSNLTWAEFTINVKVNGAQEAFDSWDGEQMTQTSWAVSA
ncbi:hypothetical protein NliqN6_4689 [Naganishia liquefaciens]|uniref:Uncharacterized protein n=1 Tax=Naganishia liquefaciens TaxID=104408 RepID=A0A8H3YHK5_9TREE|nr:hypothetical protein NliqN6_4689 [Naganishia liquefaciens]